MARAPFFLVESMWSFRQSQVSGLGGHGRASILTLHITTPPVRFSNVSPKCVHVMRRCHTGCMRAFLSCAFTNVFYNKSVRHTGHNFGQIHMTTSCFSFICFRTYSHKTFVLYSHVFFSTTIFITQDTIPDPVSFLCVGNRNTVLKHNIFCTEAIVYSI